MGLSKRESSQTGSFLGLPIFTPDFFFGFKTYPLHDSHCLSPLTGLHLVRVISNFSMLQKTVLGIRREFSTLRYSPGSTKKRTRLFSVRG